MKKSGKKSASKKNAAQVENQQTMEAVVNEQETPVTETPKDAATENPAPVQDAAPASNPPAQENPQQGKPDADKPDAWKPGVKTSREVLLATINQNWKTVKSMCDEGNAEAKKVCDMILYTKKNQASTPATELRKLVDDLIAVCGDKFVTPPLKKEDAKKLLKSAQESKPTEKPTEGKSDEKKPDAANPNPAPVQQEDKKPVEEPKKLIAGIFPPVLKINTGEKDDNGNPIAYLCKPVRFKDWDEARKVIDTDGVPTYAAHLWTATQIKQFNKKGWKSAWKKGEKHQFPGDLDLSEVIHIHPEAPVMWGCSLYDAQLYEMGGDKFWEPDENRDGILYVNSIETMVYCAVERVNVEAPAENGKK